MKVILGLDLGTNSIGWALVLENGEIKEILGLGSRIIPMSQDILGEFEKGNSVSQTAERTQFRGVRRLHERHLLRRERLHRVLNLLGFLPAHYANEIDFEKRFGKFKNNAEPKLVYRLDEATKNHEFIFKQSFEEMLAEFKQAQPDLLCDGKKIPYDWTIYYLRKKALKHKIEKEELAWLLLNFNQKRGYYQLRGEEEEEKENKIEEFYSLLVTNVYPDTEGKVKKDEVWYNVVLENGWIYRRTSKFPLDWVGKTKDFIVTTELDENKNIKKDKDGKEKRSFRAPSEDDWTLVKKKTESDVLKSNKTVGCYIYETLLQNPSQKINGKLVRTIERKFYKQELEAILLKQKEFHAELTESKLYKDCLNELYHFNESHQNSIISKDFVHLFLNDIIFYQRPLKSKKSLISDCPYESRKYRLNGEEKTEGIKCIAKSNPLFQEFRLWQFIQNLKIHAREQVVNGKIETDVNVTDQFLKTDEDAVALFDWLNARKAITQDVLFTSYFKIKKAKGESELPYRWNYVEDKEYPCNETYSPIHSRLEKCSSVPANFLNKEKEYELWHLLYSVEDKHELVKALSSFAKKNSLGDDFVVQFSKFPPFLKEYGSYSEKAIKKLLPLMRKGTYWDSNNFHQQTAERINKIINGEFDEKIRDRVREKAIQLTRIEDFKGLPLWLACYVVYDRHSEASDISKWKTPEDVEIYLKNVFKQHSLRNPIVEQVIAETLRVVVDIWKFYGNSQPDFFSEIHIELGREMKNPADKRKQMTQRVTENENTNLRIKALLMEFMNDPDIEEVRPYSPSQQEILKIYEDGVLGSDIEIPDDILKISKQNQPSQSEITRYKLWLDQKYRSPYTGEMIPLGKLFTSAYQIEHVIPQSRYFDDSLSNKVICEAEVNKDKDNCTAYAYIKNNQNKIIELGFGKKVKINSLSAYEDFVKKNFANNRSKMKKLLMEEIPEDFINRQLNDSRYISKVVKSLLSNIVREESEQEATSKHVLSSNGSITTTLKQDWGLNDVWNSIITPRFERLNELSKSNAFGEWTNKEGKKVFQTQVPIELQKGFNKKRIDHRHHALDALIIACATRNHINYLNNEHAHRKDEQLRFDLRNKLRRIEQIEIEKKDGDTVVRKQISVAKEFLKPWDSFTVDAQRALTSTVVSFKQNLRVINKTNNKYQSYKDENGVVRIGSNGKPEKGITEQTKGDNWAIRKAMHKDTVSGVVSVRYTKDVSLSTAIDNVTAIVDKNLQSIIKGLILKYPDKSKIVQIIKDNDNQWNGKDISKIEINWTEREKVSISTALESIQYITDKQLRQYLRNLILQNFDKSQILKWFKNNPYSKEGKTITTVQIYEYTKDATASRKSLNESFTRKQLESITDSGIRLILENHLKNYIDDKGKEQFELAFNADGIDCLNKNIQTLNNGKPHLPIHKVRIMEEGSKFAVGFDGNKKQKFVEAAKGTNLFFAIYYNTETNKREYETIPLNEVIAHQKQVAHLPKADRTFVPVNNAKGQLLFSLSPNDLVYVPSKEELDNPRLVDFDNLTAEQVSNIYKVVSFSGNQCFLIRNEIATSIANKYEFSVANKMEKSIDGIMIKEVCWKIQINRIGRVIKVEGIKV